jgi:cyclic dehypoxanthinyl futalosine synthase
LKAGLGSIPGGGGEILVDRVRQKVSPLKAMSDDWLEVMDVAHRLGLYSSARR